MRRTLVALIAVMAIVASACGGESQTPGSDVDVIESGAEAVVDESTASTIAPSSTTTTTEPEPEPLRSGREAILANHTEGKPYVLWYWGAH